MTELLNNLTSQSGAATAFNKTRISFPAPAKASRCPGLVVALEDVRIGG